MAFTKKSLNDHFQASFGQESETARVSKDGLIVGGVYNATAPTIADGEFARLQVDSGGLLRSANNYIEAVKGTITIPTSDTVTTGTATQTLNGLLRAVTLVTPAMEDTDSTQLDLNDSYGYQIFSTGTIAESTTSTTYFGGTALERPLFGTTTLIVTAEGTQSASRAIIYTLKVAK